MYILLEELSALHPHASLHSNRLDLRFDFHSPLIDYKVRASNLVYNVTAAQLQEMVDRGIAPRGSFVCSGMPPREVIDSGCDIIWLESAPVIGEMVVRMTEVFTKYLRWESEVRDAIIEGAPLKRIAELSREIIGRPIWAWNGQYQTLFNIVEPTRYELPSDYFFQGDFSEWNAWMIAQWEEEAARRGGRLLVSNDPFFMPTPKEGGLSYRCLCKNLFHGRTRMATLCIDEVGVPFSDRDFVLLDMLGGFMTEALNFGGQATADTVQVLHESLLSLVRGAPVTYADVDAAVRDAGWGSDEYYALLLVPDHDSYSDRLLSRVAHELCIGSDGLLYTVFDHRLLLIVNEERASLYARPFVSSVEERLAEEGIAMRMGASSLWSNLERLDRAYRQAVRALELGRARIAERCTFFDDVLMTEVVERCGIGIDAETIMTRGVRRLIDHDRVRGDDLTRVLQVYLDCNCSMTAASRALFLHRNTLAYKVERIKELLDSDLSDADERLLTSLALRLSSYSRTLALP